MVYQLYSHSDLFMALQTLVQSRMVLRDSKSQVKASTPFVPTFPRTYCYQTLVINSPDLRMPSLLHSSPVLIDDADGDNAEAVFPWFNATKDTRGRLGIHQNACLFISFDIDRV